MTWQRVDENIYIDDTLVTCAEYQLFIDEMREQGKYYQPEHWTSYQFPTGQARKPIFGVGYWDAIAFCDWLTKLDNEKKKFRLPTLDEVRHIPLHYASHQPFGYWILGENGNYGFLILHNEFDKKIRDISIAQIFALDPEMESNLEQAIDKHRERDVPLLQALEEALTSEDVVDPGRHGHVIKRDLESERVVAIDLALNNARELILDRAFTIDIKLYADLITLKERIAGHSPAFEGIRLVKEQIR